MKLYKGLIIPIISEILYAIKKPIPTVARTNTIDNPNLGSNGPICHQSSKILPEGVNFPAYFSIDYDRTFLRVFEKCNKDELLKSKYKTTYSLIKSFGTTFASRYEKYFNKY